MTAAHTNQLPDIFVGCHLIWELGKLDRAMVSYNRIESRKSDFQANDWILDSGAFTRITSGRGHRPTSEYAAAVRRWAVCGNMVAAVQQDFMCEPFALKITGLTVAEHQRRTLLNYLELRDAVGSDAYVMPVIQGFHPHDYSTHVSDLSPHLEHSQWVGVGSVCKRQGSPEILARIIQEIRAVRPDLRLHGFGVKTTALRRIDVREGFSSVDSMAWSYAARFEGRNANSIKEALRWEQQVVTSAPAATQALLNFGR